MSVILEKQEKANVQSMNFVKRRVGYVPLLQQWALLRTAVTAVLPKQRLGLRAGDKYGEQSGQEGQKTTNGFGSLGWVCFVFVKLSFRTILKCKWLVILYQ